ncbi:MAG: hypothetical protein LBU11_12205 [Zoogloeaceae bacterium]|jgi:hypothetical protein|nr:hypothetical protein [Zoogloeaceae bacterium]
MIQNVSKEEELEIPVSYTVVGCTHKDLVLLKSVIALYGTQGNAAWDYRRSLEVDLVVIGTETAPAKVVSILRSKEDAEQVFLWISEEPLSLPPGHVAIWYCRPPLHAYELVGRLKQIESFFRKKLAQQQEELARQQIHTFTSDFAEGSFSEDARVALLRWPSLELLSRNKSFWRIAAMLSARSMTLAELAEHSAEPRGLCREFLQSLSQAGYVQIIDAHERKEIAPPPEHHPLPATDRDADALKGLKDLFRRIRVGLGFSSA